MAMPKKQTYVTNYDGDAKIFDNKADAETDIKEMIGEGCEKDNIKVYKATEVFFTSEVRIS